MPTASIQPQEVILVSANDGLAKFDGLYGPVVNGRINIAGINIGLSLLETFDAVENTVIAFIDANRCKHTASNIVKRVLSPESKFIFVGNMNQPSYSDLFTQTLYMIQVQKDQPGLYDLFNNKDVLIGSAGLESERLGIPTITKLEDLPSLTSLQSAMLPTGDYGFMYLRETTNGKDFKLIAQYIKLSGHDKFILVGDFANKKAGIESTFLLDTTFPTTQINLPPIEYHQSLPNGVMRHMVANASGSLVLSTGTTSTLEAMRDKKLPYYQDQTNNEEFVASYLLAVKSIAASDTTLVGAMPQFIVELSSLLFAHKPLSKMQMERTHDLLVMSSLSSRLIAANQTIIEQASGKLAPRLLGFLNNTRNTQDQTQLAMVCKSLRTPNETGSPVHDQALRRAATWGRLFELKVLLKALPNLDKTDPKYKRSALHWASLNKNFDCAHALTKGGASLNIQDIDGKTPLHNAINNGHKQLIALLIKAGASMNIRDNMRKNAEDCADDAGILSFVKDCQVGSQSNQI